MNGNILMMKEFSEEVKKGRIICFVGFKTGRTALENA
jgi:hypothetical protein